ncbi:FRG domain-containing protein [Trichococcus shcherbakoviae]|nr:FRG domain-containing protein [Trichococcus shcherbakoviae]
MELTEDELLQKIKQQALLENLICIDDFIEIYQGKEIMNMKVEEKKNHIKKFIDNKIYPLLQSGEPYQDFSVKDYGDLSREGSDYNPGSYEIQKKYLIKENVRVEFITNVNEFLNKFYSKYRNEALQKVILLKDELESNKKISEFNKREEIKITEDDVYTELQSNLKYIYYRGHDSMNYSLLPSIYREKYIKYENEMYFELISRRPDSFVNSNKHIDILRKMQHYGMATRLLDITSNPLIGLFFAVSINRELDGELTIFKLESKHLKNNNSDTVEILSALATQSFEKKKEIVKVAREYADKILEITGTAENDLTDALIKDFNEVRCIKLLLHEIRQTVGDFDGIINPSHLFNCLFVRTLQDNDRIIRQDGLFVITGLPSEEKDDLYQEGIKKKIEEFRLKADVDYGMESNNTITRYIVPAVNKYQIQVDLSLMGVNERYVYPELESVAKYIKNEYSKK